jgi:flagellin
MSVINTNISSMQAQSSVRTSGLNLSTAMERLSSGVRINSAKDDAAGLAISTRMTASIRGISAAIRNANDGISLTQTAEGSLGQISDNLQRIRELAVQAANTGNNASDRAAMNNEATQLIAEIDRVASNTTYNGIKLLDGSFQAQNLQVGAGNGSNDRIAISVDSAKSSSLGVGASSSYETNLYGVEVGTAPLESGALAINGYTVGDAVSDGVSYTGDTSSAISVAAAINAISGNSGVYATVSSTNTTITLAGTTATGHSVAIAAGDVKINGVSIGALSTAGSATARGDAMVLAINAKTGETGVVATNSAGAVSLTSTSGKLVIETGTTGTSGKTGLASTVVANSTLETYGGTTVTATGRAVALAAGDVLINGVDIGAIAAAGSIAERGGQVSAAINAISTQTGVTAGFDTTTGRVFLSASDGRNITVTTTANATAVKTGLSSGGATTDTTRSVISLSSSSESGITIADIGGASDTASGLTVGHTEATETSGAGVSSLDLTTAAGAQDALTTLDSAIDTITNSRAAMGAYQNRLTASIANLETTSMNLSASRSRILDTDYAKETTNLAKSQIIQQAATAMLAQANQSGQSVLALLK